MKRRRQERPRGRRIEIVQKRRRKRGGGTLKQWTYSVKIRGGRTIYTSEETFKSEDYARMRAQRDYPTCAVWTHGGETGWEKIAEGATAATGRA